MPTLQDLLTQRDQLAHQLSALDNQIEEARRVERQINIAKAKAMLAELGLTAADLGGSADRSASLKPASKSRGKVPIKYRNQATGDAWSGRGLQPRWLRTAIEGGAKLEDFTV
jgi:DNA-binding protein H-NS